MHACRVKQALASVKTLPPNPPLLSDRCVPYKYREAAASGAQHATLDQRSAYEAGFVAQTLVAAPLVVPRQRKWRRSWRWRWRGARQQRPGRRLATQRHRVIQGGTSRAREKRAAGARRGAMPQPTMSDLGGAGGGDESEWNQSSGGSIASSSTGGLPTPQHQGFRARGGPRRGGSAGSRKNGPGNGEGQVWTIDEKVYICQAFKVVAQRSNTGADWSRDGLWDTIKEDSVKSISKSLNLSELKSRWSERTAGTMQTLFDRKIAPDEQRFAHFFEVVSDKK